MLRIWMVCVVVIGLIAVGCSKKQEEIDSIQQEAAEDEAAEVLDSLSRAAREYDTAAVRASESATMQQPVTPKPKEPEPMYPDQEGFVVQVGSYFDRGLADYWADRYRNWGYEAFVQTADIGDAVYYRLRIGVFATYEEALEIGKFLEDRYSAEYWVDNNR